MAHPRFLSIIIPTYNEELTIAKMLNQLTNLGIPSWRTQLIVVNDGSTDHTPRILSRLSRPFTILHHRHNLGKGAAIRTGLTHATGTAPLIQDADLEYDPQDIPQLIKNFHPGNH